MLEVGFVSADGRFITVCLTEHTPGKVSHNSVISREKDLSLHMYVILLGNFLMSP